MTEPWQLKVYDGQQLVYTANLTGPAVLGRQSKGEAAPYFHGPDADGWRVVLARFDEDVVSRRQLRVEPLGGSRVRLTNLSQKQTVRFADGGKLDPGSTCEVALPQVLGLGNRTVRFQGPDTSEAELQSLSEATCAPGKGLLNVDQQVTRSLAAGGSVEGEAIVRWLQATLGVLQGAAGSSDFFAQAARAVVELVGLDSGRVLLLDSQGEWKVQAVQPATATAPEADWQPSRQVLARVLSERRTFWLVPSMTRHEGSLLGVRAVVAAPILDRREEVIGALYGVRRQLGGPGLWRPITRLEAMLVDVLAGAVAAGLARLEHEQAAVRAQVKLEQFFGRELHQQLEARPELLQPRDAEVTILFCDIRGFSRISERLGCAGTVEWIGDIMEVLSECVLAEAGVVVEYIGDELMAMWGAPVSLPDHACRACRAALAMLGRLPRLNERWQPILEEPLELGIGINSGQARVGNIGTSQKFKYGPLGTTVNLASRVQGATKYLKTAVLLTRATRDYLGDEFATRRLCRVRVVNINEPVELFELAVGNRPEWPELRADYEKALEKFEAGNFRTAVRILANIHSELPEDGPTMVLLARAVGRLTQQEPGPTDTVWELPGK
jgi:adenylate cyclase